MISNIEQLVKPGTEIHSDLVEWLDTVPLLSWMISKNRTYAKNLNRDESGKIIVDITKPHILEDVNYFREAAIAFEKFGKYTDYYPSKSPTSPYRKFWDEEIRRCKDGYVRKSDGEWISGYYYFYLNYSPILKTEVIGERSDDGTIQAERVEGFPDFWDGDYLFYHYVDQAEKAGKYGTVLKARGKGYSFKAGSMLCRNYFLFKNSKSFALAADKEYLTTDGILDSKAWDNFSFVISNAGFAKKLTITDTVMHKKSGYKKIGSSGEYGFKSEIIGVTLKNDPDKARGKRGKLVVWEEAGCHIKGTKVIMYGGSLKNVEDIVIGDILLGPDSRPRKVLKLHTGTDHMYEIKPKNGLSQIVNSKHNIYVEYQDYYKKEKAVRKIMTPIEYLDIINKYPKRKYHYSLLRPDIIDFPKQKIRLDPYILGLWLGDGESDRASFSNIDSEIINYLIQFTKNNNLGITIKDIKGTDCKRINFRGDGVRQNNWVKKELKSMGLLNNKDIPGKYIYTDKESRLKLLAGLIDSDGSYNKKKKAIELTQHEKRKHIIKKAAYIARSLGMKVSLKKKISKQRILNGKIIKGGEIQWRMDILYGHESIPCLIPRKQSTDRKGFLRNNLSTRFNIEYYGVDNYYGFTLDEDHLFLTEDFTITHNSFPYILKSWRLAQKSMEDGFRVFGFMLSFGTGGEEDVDFIGLESLFYSSKAYRVYSVNNVWDKNSESGECAFFVPDYLNRADCYDKNGNSNVTKALVEVLKRRLEVKYSSNDTTDFAQVKAEEPITPQESVMRTEGTIFPVADLKEYLASIAPTLEHFVGPHYIAELNWTSSNSVTLKPKFDINPIRDYPYKGKNKEGAIEVFELAKVIAGESRPTLGRYIGGCDPVDDDEGTSLFSVYIMDLFTDSIVAEYTGRMSKAESNFEIALKLAVYYNAQINYENKLKGMFDFFNRRNALNYLMDTPEVLKDMEYIKQTHLIGNKAKGTPPNPQINKWGRRLQADWMMSINEHDPDKKLNLHRIRTIGYLKECIQWNMDGNFDRVSAGIMLFIARANKLKFVETNKQNSKNKDEDAYSSDPFFRDNPASFEIGETGGLTISDIFDM